MIIKEINIRSFAGLKNKVIVLDENLNLIYGENEKGKSSIQAFIKLWLFGIQKGDRVSREKYLPFNGEKMDGDLKVDYKGHEYIIKRRFGKSKKDDFLETIDGMSGEKINLKGKEIGEYFFEISEKTFTKTAFISQQGVEVIKDKKEDGIKERLQNIFITENDEVSIEKAIEKLKLKRKEISNNRQNGKLDLINKKIDTKVREYHKTNAAIESNLEIQLSLKNEKIKRNNAKEKIDKLEVYKKHLKKMYLRKDYDDILKYFNKNKEIKEAKEKINNELVKDDFKITEDYLDKMEMKIIEYLNLKGKVEEELKHKENYLNSKEYIEKDEEFEVFSSLGGNVKEKLIKLNSEISVFKEKLDNEKKLYALIEEEERKIFINDKKLGELKKIKDNREHLKKLLNREEELEKNLKINKVAIDSKAIIGIAVILLCGMSIGVVYKNYILLIILIGAGAFLGYFYYAQNNKANKGEKRTEEKLKEVKRELQKYDCTKENLEYIDKIARDEEKSNFIIEERLNRIEDLNLDEERKRHIQNEKMIESILSMTDSKNIEELLLKVDNYEKNNSRLEVLKNDILFINKNIEDLNIKSREIKNIVLEEIIKIEENADINNGLEVVKEYREKIKRKRELSLDIKNIEEAYNTLLKDRDINEIKESLEIASDEEVSEYKKEEEIEIELKRYSKELMEMEKEIKVLEGEIKLSLNGFRDINIIKEEIDNLNEERIKGEKNVKAIDIALSGLNEIEQNIKAKFAPEVNKYVGKIFNKLTNGKYKNVILKEDYSLEVQGERWFKSKFLSGGAKDQIYLALRLAFINIIFKKEEIPIIFDEVFLQYDDNRREIAIKYLDTEVKNQKIIFTCQKIEEEIINRNKIKYNRVVI
ncbi:AAA family ATPase [uncultured Clostridium sp.]|uniref:AAA family ATPase n=1 Tax=uncultured Clostridium sp. TaxID=59620 RepID=UPI002638B65C|nr:AAA family ATPase [uncultured Clostridium sp.]